MQDLLAVGYCLFSYNTPAAGLVCCWSLKNIEVGQQHFHSYFPAVHSVSNITHDVSAKKLGSTLMPMVLNHRTMFTSSVVLLDAFICYTSCDPNF